MKSQSRLTERIEREAHKLLELYDCLRSPVPVQLLARRLGLQIEPAAFADDVSGALIVRQNGGIIGYNISHAPVRQRFTIAHEIGHFALHRAASQLFIDKGYTAFMRDGRSTTGEDRREVDANQFAAALLMPADLVRQEVQRIGIDLADESSLEELASVFQVSRQAMSYRLSNLGLI